MRAHRAGHEPAAAQLVEHTGSGKISDSNFSPSSTLKRCSSAVGSASFNTHSVTGAWRCRNRHCFEPADAALPRLKKSRQLLQRGLQHFENQRLIPELINQLATPAKAFAGIKPGWQVRCVAR